MIYPNPSRRDRALDNGREILAQPARVRRLRSAFASRSDFVSCVNA